MVFILVSMTVILSVSMLFAAGGDAHHNEFNLNTEIWRIINFAVLAGVLYFALAKPLRNLFSSRRKEIKDTLGAAKNSRDEAENKMKEYLSKLNSIEEEIQRIRKNADEEFIREKEKMILDAEEEARRIIDEAKQKIQVEIERSRKKLKEDASLLAIQMAEELIKQRIGEKEQRELIREYVNKIGE